MIDALAADWARRFGGVESRLDRAPINVREERFDILWPLGGLVIEQEGVLPHVHHEDRREACDIVGLVQRDPVIRELPRRRVLVADGPADAAHLADADEVGLPRVVAAAARFSRLVK